jgi:26S proteasome regulatory subunit N2
LGEFDDAVEFALGAGKLFDVKQSDASQYVETIIGKCIDKYSKLRSAGETVDPRLVAVVERMFQKCLDDGEYKQAIGIALEAFRLDVVEKAIGQAGQKGAEPLLEYVLDVAVNLVQNLGFRNQILQLLVKLFKALPEPDYLAISQCFLWLNDSTSMVAFLTSLVKGDEKHQLIAYQIAFDVYDNATQQFLQNLLKELPAGKSEKPSTDAMETDDVKPAKPSDPFSKIALILSGNLTIQLHLEFLYRNNKADSLILKNIKVRFFVRYIVFRIIYIYRELLNHAVRFTFQL